MLVCALAYESDTLLALIGLVNPGAIFAISAVRGLPIVR